jgi:hypothetical protein
MLTTLAFAKLFNLDVISRLRRKSAKKLRGQRKLNLRLERPNVEKLLWALPRARAR